MLPHAQGVAMMQGRELVLAWPGSQAAAFFLLGTLVVVLGLVLFFSWLMVREARRFQARGRPSISFGSGHFPIGRNLRYLTFAGPRRWLAIRSTDQGRVVEALGLGELRPCSWLEGLSCPDPDQLLLSPPVQGWVLVTGPGLPDPVDDVDECFRFLMDLSRGLGQVQYFSFNRVVGHHAWARLYDGNVIRAYAWAGSTLWNQGALTALERKLGMRCLDYGEAIADEGFLQPNRMIAANLDRVPLLAAKWSLDPFSLDDRHPAMARGVAARWTHSRIS